MKDEKKKKAHLIKELKELRKRITELETTVVDELTGLHNLRNFFILGEHEFARANRYERSLSFVMISLDNLEQIRETYGGDIVNQILVVVADRCRTNVRYVDILGHYGDEQFILMLPEADLTASRKIAERIRQMIAETPVSTEEGVISVTVSQGVSNLTVKTHNLIAIMERADKALGLAKEKGGNRVDIGIEVLPPAIPSEVNPLNSKQ